MFVDRDTIGEVLALADTDVEQAVDDQVVDLGNATVELDTKVVDGHLVRVVAEVELDLVCSVALAAHAGPDRPDLLLNPGTRLSSDIRPREERLEGVNLWLLIVGRIDQHGCVPE